MRKNFASDTYSGFSAEILASMVEANKIYDYCYGGDALTKQVEQGFRDLFKTDVATFLVFNGTGANIYGLELLHTQAASVICSDVCHIYTTETGALAKAGMQTIIVKSENGKIILEELEKVLTANIGDFHAPQPKILTISQVTEKGSVYSIDELKKIQSLVKKYNIYLHIDGARLSNALVSLGLRPDEFIREIKPDVLVFGGTKNGLMFGDAVLVFNEEIAKNGLYVRKQMLQLASKMKFLSAQFVPYLKNNLWHSNAKNANFMTKYLADELTKIGLKPLNDVDANILFV
jgi:threonine aldolase